MLHVVLYQPEIPPNTGNIIRLCANSGALLHLIRPLGFSLDEKQVRRAGLDYHQLSQVMEYESLAEFIATVQPHRLIACTTKATQPHSALHYQDHDALLMGPETRGLPQEIIDSLPVEQCIRIPMAAQSRSLNLSNATAIILYEALRQLGYPQLN